MYRYQFCLKSINNHIKLYPRIRSYEITCIIIGIVLTIITITYHCLMRSTMPLNQRFVNTVFYYRHQSRCSGSGSTANNADLELQRDSIIHSPKRCSVAYDILQMPRSILYCHTWSWNRWDSSQEHCSTLILISIETKQQEHKKSPKWTILAENSMVHIEETHILRQLIYSESFSLRATSTKMALVFRDCHWLNYYFWR